MPTSIENAAGRRFRAAVELERARQNAREAGNIGRATGTDRRRVEAAEAAWNACTTAGRPAAA